MGDGWRRVDENTPKNDRILIYFNYQGDWEVATGLHWLGDQWTADGSYYETTVKPTQWKPLDWPEEQP